MQGLTNKVAVVTGAARGIGFGIARRLSAEGARVIVSDMREDAARDAAAQIREESGNAALGMFCDVTDRASVDAMTERAISEFGALDIAVANAGICPFVDFLDLDAATWQKTIDVILTGSFHTAQSAARAMVKRSSESSVGGRIIFITSLATLSAFSNQADYAAAKSGVRMLMASIAPALGKYDITANAVAPGVIYTEMGKDHWDVPEHRERFARENPIGRLGEPADIAAAVAFLASDDARYITGATLRVDGGRMCIG